MSFFGPNEFACQDGCGFNSPHPLLVLIVEGIRSKLGIPVTVSSGCRCQKHNAAGGGAAGSQHMQGIAADLACSDLPTLRQLANDAGLSVGDGERLGFIHVDVRNLIGHPAAKWSY